MTWERTKASLRRAKPETRERRLVEAFRTLTVDAQVIAVAYAENVAALQRRVEERERTTKR